MAGRSATTDEGWIAVVTELAPVLRGVARRRLSGATRQDVDDAVAETVARTCRRATEAGLPDAALDRWIVAVLCNVVREQNRRAARTTPGVPWVAEPSDPLDVVIDAEDAGAVRSAYAALALDDREVLRLRVIEGLDSTQAAVTLGKRPGAVRMAQARALGRLREQLTAVAG